jgi:hypothetical protein
MKCPDCGIEIARLPCERCKGEAARHELEIQSLVKRFLLVRGAPETDDHRASLDSALVHLQRRLDNEQFRETVSFNARDLLRGQHWWYIPYGWIGCRGFIVNMESGYVNWLGSALSLSNCFWGHEHGIYHDMLDFAFSPDTDRNLAARLLRRFKHMHPNARGVLPGEPVWYRESEIPTALSKQFPTFKHHFVWFGIPDIFHAYEKEGLQFSCTLSKGV